MALVISSASVASVAIGDGASRRRLLDEKVQPGVRTIVDLIDLAPGAAHEASARPTGLTFVQVLEGAVTLTAPDGIFELEDRHVVFLPPAFSGTFDAAGKAVLLVAEVPDAVALDPAFASNPAPFKVVDWKNEPLLDSVHDARQRIYLATPQLFGNKAIKAETIIYPPGTTGANHFHVGADHFMYFTAGRGTAFASEEPVRVKEGDLVYYPDGERHYLSSDADSRMVFVEFFTPGTCETIWVDKSRECSWTPTGRNVEGGAASREIRAHGHGRITEDV